MSKTLYEEALADARQLKELAELNAKRAIIDSVTPRIKELIESRLLGEEASCEESDETLDETGVAAAVGVTHPSLENGSNTDEPVEEGTSDLTYELTSEAASKLLSLDDESANDRVEVGVFRLAEATNRLVSSDTATKLSEDYSRKIVETIQKIEDMYSYLQESGDSSRKAVLENKLESCFEVLNAVKESTMRMKDLLSKKNLMEDMGMDPSAPPADPASGAAPPAPSGGKELTMKITGLPDDVELDKLNIDLLTDEEDDGAEKPMDGAPELDADAAGGAPPMEMDMYGETDEVDNLAELEEDDVVEISETMLEQELARLLGKDLNEMDAAVLDDFGGGKDEGDMFLDGEVSTAEKDNMVNQSGDNGSTSKVRSPRRGVSEAKAAIARRAKQAKISEAAKNAGSKQLAETRAATESLRKQLTEMNLFNAKLLHANKLLQLEGLTARQKSVIIDKLDDAQSLKEVKLVYESLFKVIVGDKKTQVNENTRSRGVIAGSSSRVMPTSTATTSNEPAGGFETDRWAQLAGLKKK